MNNTKLSKVIFKLLIVAMVCLGLRGILQIFNTNEDILFFLTCLELLALLTMLAVYIYDSFKGQ
jgi:hypothetical protein